MGYNESNFFLLATAHFNRKLFPDINSISCIKWFPIFFRKVILAKENASMHQVPAFIRISSAVWSCLQLVIEC